MLSQEELKRLHVIDKILEGVLKQVEGAGMLSLSDRQIRRLIKKMRIEGDKGIVHQLVIKKKKTYIPPPNHPWRRYKLVIENNSYQQQELQT